LANKAMKPCPVDVWSQRQVEPALLRAAAGGPCGIPVELIHKVEQAMPEAERLIEAVMDKLGSRGGGNATLAERGASN
jgi:hypothetical protein